MDAYQVSGMREIDNALHLMSNAAAGRALINATNEAGRVIRDEMKRLVPVKTGRLRRTIRIFQRRREVKSGATVAVGVRGRGVTGLAIMVEYGTKPHVITARTKEALALGGGTVVRSVNHPGAKPKPFIRPAFDLKSPDAVRVLQRRLGEEIIKAARAGGKIRTPIMASE